MKKSVYICSQIYLSRKRKMDTQPTSLQYKLLLGDEAEKRVALKELIQTRGKEFYSFFANKRTFTLGSSGNVAIHLKQNLTKTEIDNLLSDSYILLWEQLIGIHEFRKHGRITLYQKLINTNKIKACDEWEAFGYLVEIAKNRLSNSTKKKEDKVTSSWTYFLSFFGFNKDTSIENIDNKDRRNPYYSVHYEYSIDFIEEDKHNYCLQKLSPACQNIMQLEMEGYTNPEIAKMLNQTINGLKSTKSNCKVKYKECLKSSNI